MLYPDFNELIAFKNRKSSLLHPSHRSVHSIVPGNHHSPFRGRGLEFDSVREYIPGDDIRSIDWRVTARTGFPHVKIFKEDRERRITICVDMNAPMRFGTRNTFKSVQAARIAALLGWQGIANQDRISACLFGDVQGGIQFFSPKRTRASFCSMLKMLAEPPVEEHFISLEDVFQPISQAAHTGSLIYFISDFMRIGDVHEASISRLSQRCDVLFISVNDPADKNLCPAGLIKFCISAKEKAYINTEDTAGREAYARQWKENRKRLYEISSRCKIPTIELTTESDVYRELIPGLKNLVIRRKG